MTPLVGSALPGGPRTAGCRVRRADRLFLLAFAAGGCASHGPPPPKPVVDESAGKADMVEILDLSEVHDAGESATEFSDGSIQADR